MDAFMAGIFDLNEDGHTDVGEEFMAYQLYEDMNKDDSGEEFVKNSNYCSSGRSGIKLWHIVIAILLIIWQISCMTNPYNRYSGSSSYRSGSHYRSSSYGSGSHYRSSSTSSTRSSSTYALTKEEADALRGTGYHNTRPNSSAENMELAAAQVKCKRCGMHSSNGTNSMCDSCRKITGGN